MHWLLANEYARSGGRGEPMGLEFIFSLEPLAAFILLGQARDSMSGLHSKPKIV